MLKELGLDEIKKIYEEEMIHDFPACEIKPFAAIERMHRNGEYFVYGNYEGTERIAYAFIAKPKDGNIGLLDYLAVKEEKRGSGYGSRTVGQLKGFFQNHWEGLIIESEHVNYAKCQEDKEKRQRRIHFYEKNGLVKLDFESRIFGTEYKVLYLNTNPAGMMDKNYLETEYVKIYQMMMPKDWNERYVEIWNA